MLRGSTFCRVKSTRQISSSTPREIVVARAAPSIPIAGNPSSPKISTAFSTTFRESVTMLSTMENFTRSQLRITAIYGCVSPENR